MRNDGVDVRDNGNDGVSVTVSDRVEIVASRVVVGAEAVVDEVDVAEVAVAVVMSVVVVSVFGVARARGARLVVGVTVGTDDERVVIAVVETVIAAVTWIMSVEGVRSLSERYWKVSGSGQSSQRHDHGEYDK